MTTIAKRGTPEYLREISFSNLVKSIDEKWSHTYVELKQEQSVEDIFKALAKMAPKS